MIQLSLQKHLHTADGDLLLHLDLTLKKGEFISLYGASGVGKTSILRMLAGFMSPDNGSINVGGSSWFDRDRKINVSPQRRNVGIVFQDYALFPNMNVRENIAFALKKQDPPGIVDELLEVTGLTKLALRKPQCLSGGQKQRVALARAIAQRPALLLLDEPLSAIDRELRRALQETLQEVHRRYHLTTVMVSHDVEEIVKLSDKVVHVENGKCIEYSSPAAFFDLQKGNVVDVRQDGDKTYVTVLVKNDGWKVGDGTDVHGKINEDGKNNVVDKSIITGKFKIGDSVKFERE
jgi:molybdate transport system ATP-binding protein